LRDEVPCTLLAWLSSRSSSVNLTFFEGESGWELSFLASAAASVDIGKPLVIAWGIFFLHSSSMIKALCS
jgi:hypothetical protein